MDGRCPSLRNCKFISMRQLEHTIPSSLGLKLCFYVPGDSDTMPNSPTIRVAMRTYHHLLYQGHTTQQHYPASAITLTIPWFLQFIGELVRPWSDSATATYRREVDDDAKVDLLARSSLTIPMQPCFTEGRRLYIPTNVRRR